MLTQRAAFPNARPSTIPFRVFSASAEEHHESDGPSPEWTVRQFVDGYVLPNYLNAKKRKDGTIKLYYQTVDLWEQITQDNPPLRVIEQEPSLCREWCEALKKRRGIKTKRISDNTIRKHCVHFQKILDLAGPKTRRNRGAAGVMADVPYIERPEVIVKDTNADYSLEEIGLWLGACRFAQPTKNISRCRPEIYCKNQVIFIYNTGLRIATVMQLTEPMMHRRRENWLDIPAEIYKGGKKGLHLYLNEPARAAIEACRIPGNPMLFPWKNWPTSKTWLNNYHRRILAMSGIPESRYFGNIFHGLRKSLGTWLAAQNPMVASIVLGHKSMAHLQSSFSATTRDYYTNHNIIREYLDRVPQPKAIEPERQKKLF